MRITELDIFAPETVFVRMADKSYYKVDFRRHQFTAGLSDSGAFFKAEPLDPQVAKKLGLDGYLDDKYQGRKQELPGARRYHPWAVNDPKTIAPGQSIQQGGPFGDRRVTVVDFTNPDTMVDLPNDVKSKLTKAVQQAEKTSEAKEQKPIKARDPNWRDMEALRKSGAAGSHGDKTKTIPRKEKYKKISMEDQFQQYMEADPDTLGKMNDKMRDVLSKVDTDDKAKVQAAKDKAEAERQAKMKELGPDAMDKYIDMLKKHDWTYNYSDDHRYYVKGSEEEKAIRALGDIVDPDRKIYKKYSPFHEQIEEKLSKSDDMGDWVKDFYKSDAPQFKGKSKAKRRQMAIAAKLSAESSDIFKALAQVDESVAVTQAGDISTTVSPHIAIGDKKTRKKYGLTGGLPNPPKAKRIDPKDNALDMKGTSIFGGPLKR